MSRELAWIGLHAARPDTLFEALGVRPTAKQSAEPEDAISATRTTNGWIIVAANGEAGGDDRLFDEEFISELSELGSVIWCCANKETLACTVSRWESARRRWSVSHDPSVGEEHLAAMGTPPKEFVELRDKLPADYSLYIPLELAGRITGYQHNAMTQNYGLFETLEYIPIRDGLPPTSDCARLEGFKVVGCTLGGETVPVPDVQALPGLLTGLAEDVESFLILDGADGSFIQVASSPVSSGGLLVEWQRPGPRHEQLVRRPGPFAPGSSVPIGFAIAEAEQHVRSFMRHGVPAPAAFRLDVTEEIFG